MREKTVKILHIIRSNDDQLAHQVIEEIQRTESAEQTLLMIQDGVYFRPQGLRTFACSDDVHARGIETEAPLVNQDEIVEMIFEHDKVITW